MRAVVYIFSGYNETRYQAGYKQVIKIFKRRRIKPVWVNIQWKYHTLTDYVDQFLSQYKPIANAKIYLFGFSFGAMTALIASPLIKPDKLYLCSLSPFFKEDLPTIKKTDGKALGKNRIRDLKTISFHTLAEQISCTTLLVAGDKESGDILKRTHSAKKEIRKARFYMAKGATHDLNQPEYIRALHKII